MSLRGKIFAAASSGFARTARIAIGRCGVVIRVVPVAAPFVDVVANIVEAESVRSVMGHRLWTGLPARGVVRARVRRVVTPRKLFLLETAAGSAFPLGFGGQAVASGRLFTQPFAVAGGFVPGRSGDRLLGMIETWIIPERRRSCTRCAEKALVFRIRDLRRG